MNPLLSIRNVSKHFGAGGARTQALQATDMSVDENEFITILGPSGCGKVFQSYTLFPYLTVRDNFCFGPCQHRPDLRQFPRIQS